MSFFRSLLEMSKLFGPEYREKFLNPVVRRIPGEGPPKGLHRVTGSGGAMGLPDLAEERGAHRTAHPSPGKLVPAGIRPGDKSLLHGAPLPLHKTL